MNPLDYYILPFITQNGALFIVVGVTTGILIFGVGRTRKKAMKDFVNRVGITKENIDIDGKPKMRRLL